MRSSSNDGHVAAMITAPKTSYSDFKASRSKQLSKIDILGSFDFHTTCISLDSITRSDVEEMKVAAASIAARDGKSITSSEYAAMAKVMPLAAHEFTHFIDSTSTVWGANYLSIMSKAHVSGVRANESNFVAAKNYFDFLRGIRFPDYYTEIDHSSTESRPWHYRITTGKIFDKGGLVSERPILFCRFMNNNGDTLVRSPLSIISLLEASAMAQELFWTMELLGRGDDFRFVESPRLTTKIIDHLYDKRLSEYSVCVHLVANHLGCTDVLQAFMVCSILVRTALNFPSEWFGKVSIEAIRSITILPSDHAFNLALVNGLQQNDRGVLFYLLCHALPIDCYNDPQSASGGVKKAMETLGFDASDVFVAASEEMMTLSFEDIPDESSSLTLLRRTGFENFTSTISGPLVWQLDWSRLSVPPVMLGDCEIVTLMGRKGSAMARAAFFDECYHHLYEGQRWVERFSEACL